MGISVIFLYVWCSEKGSIPKDYDHLSSILAEDGDRIQCQQIFLNKKVVRWVMSKRQ
jgi:hypothetical protein